jgi:putative FmdB family regulatory protein
VQRFGRIAGAKDVAALTESGVLLQYLPPTAGVVLMPSYDYYCKECKKTFNVIITLAEYEKGHVTCPKCKSKKVEQKPSVFFAVTSKKS